jgi:hypothetical protein
MLRENGTGQGMVDALQREQDVSYSRTSGREPFWYLKHSRCCLVFHLNGKVFLNIF